MPVQTPLPATRLQMAKAVALACAEPRRCFALVDALAAMDGAQQRLLVDAVSAVVSSLTPAHALLVDALLALPWLLDKDGCARFTAFLENLVSAHATHAQPVARMFVALLRNGKPRLTQPQSNIRTSQWLPSWTASTSLSTACCLLCLLAPPFSSRFSHLVCRTNPKTSIRTFCTAAPSCASLPTPQQSDTK